VCCRAAELSSEYGDSLPGEMICVRLETGSTEDATTSTRKQLGLQLVGRLAPEHNTSNTSTDDRSTSGVFVAGVLPGSVADVDGSIRVGDELLQVGDRTLTLTFHYNAHLLVHIARRRAQR